MGARRGWRREGVGLSALGRTMLRPQQLPAKERDLNWKPTDTELAQAELGSWGSNNNLWNTTPKYMATLSSPTS